mgnify:CR=1 FL=1
MNNSDLKDFYSYVFDFYGKNGIYDMNATKTQIKLATKERLTNIKFAKIPFDADTIDREIVRDILIDRFDLRFPKANYTLTENGIEKN